MPITQISGFKDELSGGVITNAFTLGILSAEEVKRTREVRRPRNRYASRQETSRARGPFGMVLEAFP